jgi:WD40 repeat protein
LDSYAQLAKPGDSGLNPLNAIGENPSELIRRLTTDKPTERMPAERAALPAETIALIERWQRQGATFDGEDPLAAIFDIVPAVDYGPAPETYVAPLPVTALSFSPDGSQVLVGGYHELTVWDATTGELTRRISNLPERIYAIQWQSDNKQVVVAGGEPGRIGEIRVVDWESGRVTKVFGRATDVVQSLSFQPGGQKLASGNSDGTLRWFDIQDGRLIRSLAGHADSVAAISWSHDGKRLASASRDKTAKVYDADTGELLATYSGHAEPVTGICFNEGDKEVTSVGADKKIHRWQIEESKRLAAVSLPETATRLLEDRKHVWLALTDRTVRQVELVSTKLTRQLEGHSNWVTSLAVHPESNRLASGSLNGEIRIWKTDDGSAGPQWIASPGAKSVAPAGL